MIKKAEDILNEAQDANKEIEDAINEISEMEKEIIKEVIKKIKREQINRLFADKISELKLEYAIWRTRMRDSDYDTPPYMDDMKLTLMAINNMIVELKDRNERDRLRESAKIREERRRNV